MDVLGDLWVLAIGSAVWGAFKLWKRVAERRRRRREQAAFDAVPRRAIGELAEGGTVIKVRGRVVLGKQFVTSPITGDRCAAYEIEVRWTEDEEWGRGSSSALQRLGLDCEYAPFFVADGTGVLHVPREQLVVHLLPGRRVDRDDPRAEATFDRHVAPANATCEERILPEGGEVEVFGILRVAAFDLPAGALATDARARGYRDSPLRFEMMPPPDGSLVIRESLSHSPPA